MAAPMASEKETILFSEKVFSDGVLEGGDARFAMITEEMFRLCGDDFGARVEQVAAGWTKADGEQFEATEISADPALTVYTVTGETPYIQDGVAHLANAFVCHPDGTAQTVRFLVSGPRPEDLVEDGNARAQALLQGLLAGDRELARDARTLELPSYAKDSPLKIDVPADYGVYTNEGPDFVVHYITAMTPINDPYNTLGIYLGDHPSPHREAESEEPGELMGKPVKWQQSTSSADGGGQTWHRETLVKPDVSGVPTYAHIFITADDEAGMAEMMKVVETLRF